MMLGALEVSTKTGTVLKGNIFKTPGSQTVVILITGVEGNIRNNPFYTVIGKKLQQEKVDLIIGHTRDAFNRVAAFNAKTKVKEIYGAFDEDFGKSDDDVEAYLTYARNAGYSHIILGGQSFGANKVIHYLANHHSTNIEHFLLMSPVDVEVLRKSITNRQRQIIDEYLVNGDDNKILPFRMFRWLTSTAINAKRWLDDDTLNNVHAANDGDFSQLEHVNYNGAMLIGMYDRFAGNSPKRYLENLNAHLLNKSENTLIYIPNTGHIYSHQEERVAQEIKKLLKNWRLLKNG
ncbi:DUF1749 domain-containing protein [Limosilactobacillus sp. STM2_1]|uniref:DUF1749 domain-containing protein n=1 Tax=Limosilactobacillus rudii TaxID=2759755 RepID=A0A7W3UMU7_9LACO|nr:DUF1749 domain-containing protein [Limosilactobacillus rudii]MBB1080457.1 DUF1749 domain-containing protein [Limosilactobacillus rudii]MBB1098483.1 DUF1749 domain-containing protein [Limosilactobacillus rudii]MCD7135491.1 alpha/beta hydrolase [Limosilactobacillus rudii]